MQSLQTRCLSSPFHCVLQSTSRRFLDVFTYLHSISKVCVYAMEIHQLSLESVDFGDQYLQILVLWGERFCHLLGTFIHVAG
jgi:hypothetical protein